VAPQAAKRGDHGIREPPGVDFASSLQHSYWCDTAPIAGASATVAPHQEPREAEAVPGNAGFDIGDYPGDACMAWLKGNTNLVWCGYYLGPAPSHPDTSWMTRRPALAAAGWGIAPIYVGEQVIPPGSEHPSAAKGQIDGADAAQLLTSDGFAPGSCVYLDLEDGSLPAMLSDYTKAWITAVATGGFQPGVYCSHVIAAAVGAMQPNLPVWAFKVAATAIHPVAGPPFREDDPAGSGFAPAVAWQLDQNGTIGVPPAPGGKLQIDLSSASTADPGAPGVAG
jgi:Rv2525c-like, glycoside hydrolase-like domain